MPWRDVVVPPQMQRVAVVAPKSRLRRVLIEVADFGHFEPDEAASPRHDGAAARMLSRSAAGNGSTVSPILVVSDAEPESLESLSLDLLAGEASLEQQLEATSRHRIVRNPPRLDTHRSGARAIRPTRSARWRLGRVTTPAGCDAADSIQYSGLGSQLRPLVTTYATVPYRDVDPTLFAAGAYMVMFGMMFGDVAHGGALLASVWLPVRRRWPVPRRQAGSLRS